MRTEQHIWKTHDDRYTLDGEGPAAAALAYAAGDEVPDEVLAELTGKDKKTVKKAAAKPADKSVSKPNDK